MNMYTTFNSSKCSYHNKHKEGEFKLIKIASDCSINHNDIRYSVIIFSITSSVEICILGNPSIHVPAKHMFHIIKGSSFTIKAPAKASLIMLSFKGIDYVCYKTEYAKLTNQIDALKLAQSPIPIKPILLGCMEQVQRYLQESICCHHLQELKRKEVSILLKHLYTIEELAPLITDMMQASNDFNANVHYHASKARNAKELAQLCGYSMKTFERTFKQQFDSTPYQWINKQKKTQLMEYLSDKNLSIKQIAMTMQFASSSHLNSFCKKQFGVTTSQLRVKLEYGNKKN